MIENTGNIERELGWDDYIENDNSQSYVLLPEGDYDFTITGFERARHTPSEKGKLPPCNKAILTIEINSQNGTARIIHNLFLHRRTEGMLCAFFTAIGQRKQGEKIQMNWNRVVGATGRCKIGIDTYIKNDGSEGKSNKIKQFYPKEENKNNSPIPATPYSTYQPGNF